MLNTKEHFKQIEMDTIQQEPLFTELAPEAAAVVEGGLASFGADVDFDRYLPTRSFSVRPGGNITLASNTSSGPDDKIFSASVRNVNTGRITPPKSVRVGNGTITKWTGMRGGTYSIDLRDTQDNINVVGRIGVAYDD